MSKEKHLNYWIIIPPEKETPTFKGSIKSRVFHYGSTMNLCKEFKCKQNKDNRSIVHKRDALNGTIDCGWCTSLSSQWKTDVGSDNVNAIYIAQCFNCKSYFCTPDIHKLLEICMKCHKKWICLECVLYCETIFERHIRTICGQCCPCKGCHPTPQTIKRRKEFEEKEFKRRCIVKPISKKQHDELNNKSSININDFF